MRDLEVYLPYAPAKGFYSNVKRTMNVFPGVIIFLSTTRLKHSITLRTSHRTPAKGFDLSTSRRLDSTLSKIKLTAQYTEYRIKESLQNTRKAPCPSSTTRSDLLSSERPNGRAVQTNASLLTSAAAKSFGPYVKSASSS